MQIVDRGCLALFLLVMLAACGASDVEPGRPAPAPDIRGTLIELRLAAPGGQILGTALIEGPVADGTRFDKASVRITTATRVWEGAERRAVGVEALAAGQRVEARFIGPVAESYPVQATASEIVIVK